MPAGCLSFAVSPKYYLQYNIPLTNTEKQHNTTQQHTTIKMELCHPTLQRLSPISLWVWQRRQQLMAAPLPMVLCKLRAIGLGGATCGPSVWGANAIPIKK